MQTLRLITRDSSPRDWAQVVLPTLAVAIAAMMDQSTRGPSITQMVLMALFN